MVESPVKVKLIPGMAGLPLKYPSYAAITVSLPRCSTNLNGPVPLSRCESGPPGPPAISLADMIGRKDARKMKRWAG
ncbi:hypothetical protein D3C86_2029710 [compost metagenome]